MNTIVDGNKGASPQAENGHVDIANEIAEAMAKVNLSAYESRVLWVIWRKTYGWHKKTDQISFTQFQKATGLHRRNVQRTLNELIKRNIVVRKDYSRIITYQFQKDYTKWKDVVKRDYMASKGTTDRSLKGLTQKKLTKEINNGRSKKQTDPRVKEFFNYWEEIFQKKTGQPYVFSFGKDGDLIKNLLSVHDLPTLQDVAKTFFKDEQCKRRGLTIGIFFQEINRLLSQKVMNPLEQTKRELGWKRE